MVTAIENNHQLQKLIVSDCKVTDNKASILTYNIGIYNQLTRLELCNNHAMSLLMHKLLAVLSQSSELKKIILCNCQLQSNEIRQLIINLKGMKHLECVNLSGNAMTDDLASDIKDMIVNNKQLQKLCLPNCVLNQNSLTMIFQAMQSISSWEYIDFSANQIDDELASDVATIFHNNSKLEHAKFASLTLKNSGFQHMQKHLTKLKGLKYLNITNCTFANQEMMHKLLTVLSHSLELKQIILCDCQLQCNEIRRLIMDLKGMKHLECVDLSGNAMTDDSVRDMKAMIVNNKQLQELCLPSCVLNPVSFQSIIQAMQTISSLQYVDFGINEIISKMTSDVATLFANNSKLKEIRCSKFTISQKDFQLVSSYLRKVKGVKVISIKL